MLPDFGVVQFGFAGFVLGFRFSFCLALRGRCDRLGIGIARFPTAFVFLACLGDLPFSMTSSASERQLHILDILPYNFLHDRFMVSY